VPSLPSQLHPPSAFENLETGIRVESIRKSYRAGKVQALAGITLAVAPGEIFGLIGPNGAGKTTFLGCLLGLLFPDAGLIRIDGRPPDILSVRRRIGYLPERLSFDRWMTGRQFVAYHHALAGESAEERKAAVESALAQVEIDEDARDRPLRKYSRGMLQRLGLAQALVGRPRYLFLDEPSSGLDPAGVLLMRRLLRDLQAQGVTTVINSHQLDQLERLCGRVAFLRAGRIEAVEDLTAIADRPRLVSARWMSGNETSPGADLLPLIARDAGAKFVDAVEGAGRFVVSDDAGAFRLLTALLEAGARVTDLSSDEGRLERYFFADAPPTPAVGA
jgi:ABC-2 type transport system ATP-binding protein